MADSGLFNLDGKVALITGGTKGMGLAMATGLAQHGATVVTSSRSQEASDNAAAAINDVVGATRAHGIACNAGYKEQLQALVDKTRADHGAADIVIGNAGVNPHYGPSAEISDEQYDKTMNVNVKSNHWLGHMVAPDMAAKGGGSIMITASVGAFHASTELGTYAMSKLAVLGVMRNLALEYGPKNVRVNAICPAVIKTDFARALWESPEASARAVARVPLGRLGEPDDLKGLAVFLASDASRYITGQAHSVCGGGFMYR